jgi:hypothetical protein
MGINETRIEIKNAQLTQIKHESKTQTLQKYDWKEQTNT